MEFTVTLSALRENHACFEGYNRVVRALQKLPFTKEDERLGSYLCFSHSEPISLLSILESNRFDDALWALRCVKDCDRDVRLFAVWCVRQVQHLLTDQRSLNALDVAERFANGEATAEELDAAQDAAWDAAGDTAGDAAQDTARSAAWASTQATAWDAAGDTAQATAGDTAQATAWDAQKEMFIAMCEGRAPWQGE